MSRMPLASSTASLSSHFLVTWVGMLGYPVVIFRKVLLPPRFSYDGELIASVARNEGAAGRSFDIVGSIYRTLGLANCETVAGLIQYTLAASLILIVFFRGRQSTMTLSQTVVPILSLLLSAIFLGNFSKDAFVLPVAFAICLSRPTLSGTLLTLLIMAAYAAFFRTYWWLILGLFILALLIYRKRMTIRGWFAGLVCLTVLVAVCIVMTQGVSAEVFRLSVNGSREFADDASSMITPYLAFPEPIGGVVNSVVTGILLMFPLPLVRIGGVYYVFLAIAISTLWMTMLAAFQRVSPIQELRVLRMLAILMSFLAVQSVFEPDYGSALRHLTPLLAIIVSIISECSLRSDRNLPVAILTGRHAES